MGEEVLTTVDVPERLYPGCVYVLMLEDDTLYVGCRGPDIKPFPGEGCWLGKAVPTTRH